MLLLQVNSWFSPIDSIDKKLFWLINSKGSNVVLDNFLPFTRESSLWAPLYLFMFVFVLVNFGKKAWLWILFGICTAAIGDLVSSHLIKENIFRLRPCHDPDLAEHLRFLVIYCPKSSSFTSSHATNHFGMALFIIQTLKMHTGNWIKLFLPWAAIVCYAQVYVGVHFPLDVICGGLIGSLIGSMVAKIFNNYVGLSSLQIKSAQ